MSYSWHAPIDPVQLANQGAELIGEFPLNVLRRLADFYEKNRGLIKVNLRFERDEGSGLRIMSGYVTAAMQATCQRCLEQVDFEVSARPRLILLRPGERADLADTDDALVVDKPLPLGELVEDELLLVLPMIPLHQEGTCTTLVNDEREKQTQHGRTKPNPFLVLGSIKRKG